MRQDDIWADGNWDLFADITDWGFIALMVVLASYMFWRRIR
jgi:hypothetical protein